MTPPFHGEAAGASRAGPGMGCATARRPRRT